MFFQKELTDRIIGAAIEVHRFLGPGLLESTYEECLCREFGRRNISYARQQTIPLDYKGESLDQCYRLDLVVEEKVILELKCVDVILPIHMAQLLTYLRLSHLRIGLLLNFYVPTLKQGIRRIIL